MIEHYESDCCHVLMGDWYQEIQRCPDCKESCIAVLRERDEDEEEK